MSGNGIEIERKFVTEYPSESLRGELMSVDGAVAIGMEQIYLASDGCVRRIRRSEYPDGVKYFYTVKQGYGIVREENEREIGEDEYRRLSHEAEAGLAPVKKVRLAIPSGDRVLELDLYDGFTDYAVLEVELDSPDDELPDLRSIAVIREVTGDNRFSNKAIAKHGMAEL